MAGFDLGAVFVSFKTKIEGLDEAIAKIDKTIDTAQRGTTHLGQLGESLVSTGTRLSTAITLPFLATGALMIKSAADYEQSLAVFQSVSGATRQEMEQVSAKAKQLGNDITLPGVSASDAANAMTELAKAGLSVNDTMAASKGVLSLAKAGQMETKEAAELTANALLAFKMRGEDANKVADLLAAAANATSADVSDMGLALQQVGAQASALGVPLQDTVALIGELANVGIKGSDAGTSLKTFLMRLVPSTKEAADAMKELGIDMFDAQGKFIGTQAAIGQLEKAFKPLSQEQKAAAINTIFGSDAARAANTIIDQGVEGYNKLSGAVGKSGAAQELAAAQNAGFKGSLDAFMSTLETIGTTFGTKLLPPLTNFMKKMSDFFSGLSDGQVVAIVAFGAIVAAIGPMLVMLGMMAQGVRAVAVAFNILAANPIILLIAAIVVAIAVAAYLIIHNWDTLKKWFGDFWNWLKDAFQSGVDFLKGVWNGIANAVTAVFGPIIDAIIAYFKMILDVNIAVWNAIATVVMAVMDFIWNNVISPVLGFITGAFNIWLAVVTYIFEVFRGLAIVTFDFLWNSVIKPVIDFIVAYFQFWLGVVTAVFTAIRDVAAAIWNWIWAALIAPIINLIVGALNIAGNVINGVWNGIRSVASGVWNAIAAGFSWAWNSIVGLWNQFSGFFNGIWNSVRSGASNIASSIAGAFSGAFENAKNIVRGAVNVMIDLVNRVIRGVNSSAGKLPGVPDIPQIPRLFTGAKNFIGGLAIVGDVGGNPGELINLPRGSDVLNPSETAQALAGGGASGGGMNVTVDLRDARIVGTVPDEIAESIGDAIMRKVHLNARI